jgi:hypothetical protein
VASHPSGPRLSLDPSRETADTTTTPGDHGAGATADATLWRLAAPNNKEPGLSAGSIKYGLVAGDGFEPPTFGL